MCFVGAVEGSIFAEEEIKIMNQAEELERGFDDDDEESEFDSEAEEENRHAEEERKKAEKARREFLDTICVFIAFIIILGAAGGEDIRIFFQVI